MFPLRNPLAILALVAAILTALGGVTWQVRSYLSDVASKATLAERSACNERWLVKSRKQADKLKAMYAERFNRAQAEMSKQRQLAEIERQSLANRRASLESKLSSLTNGCWPHDIIEELRK